jgi:NAD(P)-dependent dehydrogenase (short-subunit alcohol dehydrogenase family)
LVNREIIQLTGNANIDLLQCDLSSLKSVQELAIKFNSTYPRLDVLINNAGIMLMDRQLTKDGFEKTFEVNHLSQFLLTHLLLDKIKLSEQGRIINTSAFGYKMAKFNANELAKREKYNGMQSYVNSKLCNLYFTFDLAERLKGTKITVNAYHPGIAKTKFGSENGGIVKFISAVTAPFLQSAENATKTSVFLATDENIHNVSGKFFTKLKEMKDIKPIAFNKENRDALWNLSETLVKDYLKN